MKQAAGVAAILMAVTSSAFGQGGGALIYENGAPDMGLSYAGHSARADDAATAFTNPAGMTRLKEDQLILGGFAGITDLELDLSSSTVSVPGGSTNGGGNQGTFVPGLGMFGVLNINEQFSFGFSITAISANGVDYDTNWVGRAFITENFFIVANIEPALAYKVNDWLSVGVGINILYGSLDQSLLASNLPNAATIEIKDADDWGVGVSPGILIEPVDGTRIGFTYRSEVELNLSGDVQTPGPVANFDSDFPIPQGINLSVYQEITPEFALLADFGWTDWSTFDHQPLYLGPVVADIDRGWEDTWRVGVGFEWDFTEDWKLRSGFSFDSSPVDDDELLPDIPVGDQYRFSVGLQKDFGEGKVLGFSYTMLYSDIDVDMVALPPSNAVILDGDYDPAMMHFFGANLTISF
ncbi:MAG: OmpP1/FadL family transporter [Planctomycetota bacterium]|jgi:long-chain fatty acid transport protein